MLQQWEVAVKLILSRESLITKLEDFERLASDPNRFFEKGTWSNSSASRRQVVFLQLFVSSVNLFEDESSSSVHAGPFKRLS